MKNRRLVEKGRPRSLKKHRQRAAATAANKAPQKAENLTCNEWFENLPLLAYNISLDGVIVNCNRLVVETLGYENKEELVGKPLLSTIYAPSSREKAKELL
jgi:PAS domain-containing protein